MNAWELTIVFAALAVSPYLHQATGLAMQKLVNTLRPVRTATIALGGPDAHPRTRDPARGAGHPRRPHPNRSLSPVARVRSELRPDVRHDEGSRGRVNAEVDTPGAWCKSCVKIEELTVFSVDEPAELLAGCGFGGDK